MPPPTHAGHRPPPIDAAADRQTRHRQPAGKDAAIWPDHAHAREAAELATMQTPFLLARKTGKTEKPP